MKRMLVVLDGSVQGTLALDRAPETAAAPSSSELILLNASTPPAARQVRRSAIHDPFLHKRVAELALAGAHSARVKGRPRTETGKMAAAAAHTAREEACDAIFLPEHGLTPGAVRAPGFSTGLGTHIAADPILSLSDVPVTVVTHESTRPKA
jgi:hypothetical protein